MEQLMNISAMGLRISLALFVVGSVLTALCIWKLDIRNVYLIRSGKAKKRTVMRLQEHNSMTGKLREDFDLDYTTGSLKRQGRKSGKTAERQSEEIPFAKAIHSGDTGSFNNSLPSEMPEAQKNAVLESERKAEMQETNVLNNASDTVALEGYRPDQYADWINTAYDDGEETEYLAEPRVSVEIISKELIIHTNEVIEI